MTFYAGLHSRTKISSSLRPIKSPKTTKKCMNFATLSSDSCFWTPVLYPWTSYPNPPLDQTQGESEGDKVKLVEVKFDLFISELCELWIKSHKNSPKTAALESRWMASIFFLPSDSILCKNDGGKYGRMCLHKTWYAHILSHSSSCPSPMGITSSMQETSQVRKRCCCEEQKGSEIWCLIRCFKSQFMEIVMKHLPHWFYISSRTLPRSRKCVQFRWESLRSILINSPS